MSVAKLVRASQRWMLAGFTASFTGSMLIQGSVQGLIVAGALGVVLVPVYATLTTLEDLASPLVARIVDRFPAASVLVACESIDVLLSAGALVVMVVWPSVAPVAMIAYLLLSSPIPVFIDLAEEFFAEEVSHVSPAAAAAFTVNIATTSGILAKIVALPLGAGLALLDLRVVLGGNLVLSALAVIFRVVAWQEFIRGSGIESVSDGAIADVPAGHSPRNEADHRSAWISPMVSPVASAILGVVRGLTGGYITIWVGLAFGAQYLLPALVAVGVGAVLGPQAARVLRRRHLAHYGLRAVPVVHAALGAALAILATLNDGGFPVVAAIMLCLTVYAGAVAVTTVLMMTERQLSLTGQVFRSVVGWAHSLGAGGALLGTWAAILLGMPSDPTLTLVVAAALCIVLSAWAFRSGPAVDPIRLARDTAPIGPGPSGN